jgi:inorganic pyrophosphatase/exopolyphosphatase
MTKVIVSGNKYTDIDVAACAFGLRALYNIQKQPSEVLISQIFNNSLTKTVLSWLPNDKGLKEPPNNYEVVVVDLSDPEHIDSRVDHEKIVELFDHHFGFEKLWQEKLGSNSHIEAVGSCATLIVEKIIAEKFLNQIPESILRLLAAAITSNTLNFCAQITNERDKKALKALNGVVSLDPNWPKKYYEELTLGPLKDPLKTLANDTKRQTIGAEIFVMAQMELWDGKSFLVQNKSLIDKFLSAQKADHWFFTLPSIGDGKNFIFATQKQTQDKLKKAIKVTFDEKTGIGTTEKLWLRKEIIRELKMYFEG